MVESLTAKLYVVVSKTAPSSFFETCVLMGLCVREKSRGTGVDRGASATKGKVEHCFIQLHTLCGGKKTHQGIGEQVLKVMLAR